MKKISEIIESKEWLKSEIEKFSERGVYTYKVKNEAKELLKDIKFWEDAEKYGMGKITITDEIRSEFDEVTELVERLTQYRCFQESQIHCLISNLTVWNVNDGENHYYDFLDLVRMVNAWWDITGEKPANRIAWGWEKALEKDNPRAYLYGCIRNYLKRNEKFDKDEFNDIWFGRNL